MEKKLFTGSAVVGEGYGAKMMQYWSNYGKHRVYIKRDDGKKTYGYIDLDQDNVLHCDADLKYTLQPIVNEFFEKYKVVIDY